MIFLVGKKIDGGMVGKKIDGGMTRIQRETKVIYNIGTIFDRRNCWQSGVSAWRAWLSDTSSKWMRVWHVFKNATVLIYSIDR